LANALRCVAGFFLGCLTRRALDALRGLKASFDLPVVLAVASLLGIAVHWNNGVRWQELVSLPVSSLLILSLLLMPSSALNTVLVSKPLRRLGEVSYSLYMSHALVLWGARQVVHVVLKKPDPVVGASQLSAAAAAIAYPALIAVTLLVAVVSYHTLEAPLRDAARRRLSA
jgi:peptidoglycan/LPS O-acetylase OafA/YrhL